MPLLRLLRPLSGAFFVFISRLWALFLCRVVGLVGAAPMCEI
jgi:hypothetical protein